jgi:1,4-dihydroxy-2-naphthoyl-CoA synthase
MKKLQSCIRSSHHAKNPLWLLAAYLHRSLAQTPKACTRESVLHNAHNVGDVSEIIGATLSMPPDELLVFTRMTGEVIKQMRECPVPIIAAVHGMAAGAGAVIALAADFRVCTPAARFAFLFTKVGLSGADMGAAYLLPRLVGLGHATRLLMLGDTAGREPRWQGR